MWPSAKDFRDFYAGAQGRAVRAMLSAHITRDLGETEGLRLLGLGHAAPYLEAAAARAGMAVILSNPQSGPAPWPVGGPGCAVVGDETELPFPDRAFDRVLLVHALEWTENPRGLVREIWRVLADDGRLVVAVPNRRSIWPRLDPTPFGNGRPFSRGQLEQLLRDGLFSTVACSAALVLPPGRSRVGTAMARVAERMVPRWMAGIAGLWVAVAVKEIYGVTPIGEIQSVPARMSPVGGSPRQAGGKI